MDLENSYFNCLSNEILIKILENLDTYDLLQFCVAYNTDDFLNVNTLVRNINLSRKYQLNNLKPIINKVNSDYITTLNINGLYWINANDLRRFLSKLINLETLLAIDTTLSLKQNDLNIYSTLKIKRLAINVTKDVIMTSKTCLPTIERLFIKFFIDTRSFFCHRLFPSLKVLWLEDAEHVYNGCWENANVEKFFYKSNPFYFRSYQKYQYLTHRAHQPNTLWFDDVNLQENTENSWPEEWQILQHLRADYPYPYNILYALKEKNINDILLDELNFHHKINFCVSRYCDAVKKILSSTYTKYLKKLSIDTCVLQCDCCCVKQSSSEEEVVFKKRRLGLSDESCPLLEKHLLYNLKYLQVLEIYLCRRILPRNPNHFFSIISHLEHLNHLAVEIPVGVNGKFFINVLNDCRQLKILKIASEQHNEVLNINLFKALSNTNNNLKDFKFENRHIPIFRLLNVFCDIEMPKLERITLLCDEIDEYDLNVLEKFLQHNSQLIFLYFHFTKCPLKIYKLINGILTKFRKQHPAKHFVIIKPSIADEQNYNIPHIHYQEMVICRSIVSCPNAYEEFENF